MANEITTSFTFLVEKGYLRERIQYGSIQSDMTGSTAIGGIQTIGTTAETISLVDVTTPGWCVMRNLDTANYVDIGILSGSYIPFLKLKAGEAAMFRFGTTGTIQARANTASVNLQYYIIQD